MPEEGRPSFWSWHVEDQMRCGRIFCSGLFWMVLKGRQKEKPPVLVGSIPKNRHQPDVLELRSSRKRFEPRHGSPGHHCVQRRLRACAGPVPLPGVQKGRGENPERSLI